MAGLFLRATGAEREADIEATPALQSYRAEIWTDLGAQWDSIVGGFADACLEQMAAYAVPRWGGSRLCGLVLRDVVTHEPMAAALAVIATLPLIKLGLAYVKFGPLWRRRDREPDPGVLAAALAALREMLVIRRQLVVRVMPPPDPDFGAEWQRALLDAGFTRHGAAADPERYLVDLRLSETEQRASLGSKWRSNLNKALTEGLDIREVDPVRELPQFLALYESMLARKQFADRHHVKLLPAFAAKAATTPELGVRLILACHDGAPVAGSMLVGAGDRVFAAFSASDERALPLRAGYALRWWIINRLRGSGARWLDLGGTEGDVGLKSFKTGNVGKRGRIEEISGEYDFADNALSVIVSSVLSSAHSLAQARPLQHILRSRRA